MSYPGMMMIPQIDVNERCNKDTETLVKPWKLPKPSKICFQNVNIVDVVNGEVLSGYDVYVSDSNIQHIMKASAAFSSARTGGSASDAGFQYIDCSGKFLTPGLMDNHVHIVSVQGDSGLEASITLPKTTALMRVATNTKAMLMRGFTTIRDCGGAENFIRDAIDDGVIAGPRLLFAGMALSQTGGHADMRSGALPGEATGGTIHDCNCHLNTIGVVCDGVPECLRATREQLRRGASFVKIMGGGGVASPTDKISNLQFTEEEIQAIVKVANTYGTYVTAHAYTPEAIKHCILNGVRGIEHGNLIDEDTAQLMASMGCYLTPTLSAYKMMACDQFKDFLPKAAQEKNQQVLYKGFESLLIAKKHNVTICHGSDLLGPLQGYQTQEFFIRGKILGNDEVLKSATINVARCNGLANTVGQIKVGFKADLLVMNENPLQNIVALDEPETNLCIIMKDGLIYKNSMGRGKGFVDVVV